ncbi:DUF5667 domain-containing protein [Candidatus Leptofilum sp.]|uniref:DUF5667 domain-containing protein n=1 Tax=Candidatus Leptofilum sp. TaxID=3241576 RepID=UPI003B5AFD63
MKIVHEQILFDCLEQFEAGVPIELLLAKYPHAADEIERFLTVAAQLQQLGVQPTLAAKQKSQKLFLQQAAQMRVAQRQRWFSWRTVQRTLMPLASMALVTILVGLTFLFASASSVPGDFLYDTKRWVETWQLEQAVDATAVFNLNTQQNVERLREVKSLLRTDETANVSFEGIINTKQGNHWAIAGVSVRLTEDTVVAEGAEIGALVLVNGRASEGHLYASQITVLQPVAGTATPAATATATAEPTNTNTYSPTETAVATTTQTATSVTPAITTPTVTATPKATTTPANETPIATTTPRVTVTNSPEPTPTSTPTATATPEATSTSTAVPPTSTSQPHPTITPTPDNDNDNDNGNDNDNDNDNGGGNDNDNDNDSGNDNGNDNDGDNDNENDNGGGNDNDNGG